LILRASTGAAPSVPIATVTGSRSTMAGVMKALSSRLSTMLTSAPDAPPDLRRPRVLGGVGVRAVEQRRADRVPQLHRALHQGEAPPAAQARTCATGSVPKTTIRASVLSSSRSLATAVSPAPETTTRRPRRSRKTGKCRITHQIETARFKIGRFP
jgi:hypothetical protein